MTPNELFPPERRAEARARCEAANTGPWFTEPTKNDDTGWATCTLVAAVGPGQGIYTQPEGGVFVEDNRRFIAHARTDLPDALDALDAAEDRIAELEETIESLGESLRQSGNHWSDTEATLREICAKVVGKEFVKSDPYGLPCIEVCVEKVVSLHSDLERQLEEVKRQRDEAREALDAYEKEVERLKNEMEYRDRKWLKAYTSVVGLARKNLERITNWPESQTTPQIRIRDFAQETLDRMQMKEEDALRETTDA